MSKVIDYKIVSDNASHSLERLIKEQISEGWEPEGGLLFVNGTLHQVMVLRTVEPQIISVEVQDVGASGGVSQSKTSKKNRVGL